MTLLLKATFLLETLPWNILMPQRSNPLPCVMLSPNDRLQLFPLSRSASFLLSHHSVSPVAAQLCSDHNRPWIPIWGEMDGGEGAEGGSEFLLASKNRQRQKLGLVSPLWCRCNSPCVTSISSYTTLHFNLPLRLSLGFNPSLYVFLTLLTFSPQPPFPHQISY